MDHFFDEYGLFHGDDIPSVECAVLECKEMGWTHLCFRHLDLFYDRYAKLLICWNCNSIVKLLPPNFGSTPNSFLKNKFVFCEKCRNCGDINDERKIVLDEKKEFL